MIQLPPHQIDLVVTRHPGLVQFLHAEGLPRDVPVLKHATEADVQGKHVIGVMPLALAAATASVTEVVLDVPADRRGTEFSEAEVNQWFKDIRTYHITQVKP